LRPFLHPADAAGKEASTYTRREHARTQDHLVVGAVERRPLPRSLVAICAVVVVVTGIPIIVTIGQAASGGWSEVVHAFHGTDLGSLLFRTIGVALLATPVCGILGVAGAWFVERTQLPGGRIWALLLVAPITIPVFLTSYAWSALGTEFQGFFGAFCILAVTYYPIAFLLTSAALRGMDPALEESAMALGCGTWRVFWRVVLPQLRPSLLGGLLVVALATLVEFDAFVGIHFSTFVASIYSQYQVSFSASGAATLACVSILLCALILAVETRLRGNAAYTGVSHGSRRPPERYALGRTTPIVLIGLTALATFSVEIPVYALIRWFEQATPGSSAGAAAGIGDLLPATLTSVGLGVSAAILTLLLALPIAILATRYRGRTVSILERATYLSFALPDLVAAIAFAYATSQYTGALYGNIVILVLAYAVLFCPIAVLALRVSFGQIEPSMDESARSLGLGPVRSLVRVGLPLARPGIAAGGVLIFAFVLSDLSTTQVLLPPGMVTLGTDFWADSSTVAFGASAPFAAMLMILAAGATYVLMSRFGKTRLSSAAA
jgi:iron(III) transport system permease protein